MLLIEDRRRCDKCDMYYDHLYYACPYCGFERIKITTTIGTGEEYVNEYDEHDILDVYKI